MSAKDCIKQGLPEPDFIEEYGGMTVRFYKDIYTEENLRKIGLNERQVKAVLYVKEKGKITNREYREINNISDEGVRKDIVPLIEKVILVPKGAGRSTYYELKRVGD